jgi:hypothetical protein
VWKVGVGLGEIVGLVTPSCAEIGSVGQLQQNHTGVMMQQGEVTPSGSFCQVSLSEPAHRIVVRLLRSLL